MKILFVAYSTMLSGWTALSKKRVFSAYSLWVGSLLGWTLVSMCSLSSSDGADGTGRNLGKSICTRYVCGVGQETKPIY